MYLCMICGEMTTKDYCNKCQELIDKGYYACIGIDPEKSNITDGIVKVSDAYRTGDIVWIVRRTVENLLGTQPGVNEKFVFVDTQYIKKLVGYGNNGKSGPSSFGTNGVRKKDS